MQLLAQEAVHVEDAPAPRKDTVKFVRSLASAAASAKIAGITIATIKASANAMVRLG
jgi:hypothetical protein